jgi:phospholipid transport system substrate-binding protein
MERACYVNLVKFALATVSDFAVLSAMTVVPGNLPTHSNHMNGALRPIGCTHHFCHVEISRLGSHRRLLSWDFKPSRGPVSVASKYLVLLWALGFAPLANSTNAEISDPAAIQVQRLHTSLLDSMRAGSSLAITDRYRKLEPVIEQVFDLPLMTRLAIGPGWTNFSGEQQQAAVAAFTRLTIASYVHNFHKFSGERFELDDNVLNRGADKIVQTKIIPAHDEPTSLVYRMRESGGLWKIIDVSYDGVSELTMRRTDFTAAIAAGGAPVLIDHLNKLSDVQMKQ